MDNKTKDAIKQLQAELRQVQATLSEQRAASTMPVVAVLETASRKEKSDALVRCEVNAKGQNGKLDPIVLSLAQVDRVTDEAAAGLGYAMSSPQKVGLLRALLTEEAKGAAMLGEETSLTTGSLYHHLRDLMHAGLIAQSARNHYKITDQGIRVLLVMLALASEK